MDARGRRTRESEFLPAIRRAPYARLTIYEISEEELSQLERGTPDSLFLNFAIFCLSTFSSYLVCLLTTTIANKRLFDVFVIITAISGLSGTFLLILWYKSRSSVKALIVIIRNRLQVEGVQEVPTPPGEAPQST